MAGAGGGNYQFDVGLRWLGAGPGGAAGGEGAAASPRIPGNIDQIKREKSRNDSLQKMSKTGMQHMRSTFGINIGIAAILKQSQIFTGTIGTLFQILGAFVDVILASFMPIIVPALMLLAKMIPYIRKAADNIVGNLIRFFAWVKGGLDRVGNLIPERIKKWFGEFFKTVIAHFLVITFLAKIFGFSRQWFGLWKMILIRPLLLVLNAILAATIFRGGGLGGLKGGGGKGPQIIQSSNRFANTATTAGRFGRFGAMAGRFGPMAGRIGLGTAAAGVGVAIGGVQVGMDVKKKNYWSAGGGIAGGVAGGAIGLALGGPVGAAIGASLGIMAGRMLGDALGKRLAENQAGQAPNNSYRGGNQTNAPDYGTPAMSGVEPYGSQWYSRGYVNDPQQSEFQTWKR